MKMWILAAAMMMGVTMNAQREESNTQRPPHAKERMERRHFKKEPHEKLTAEQHSELRSKHLTLALGLSDKQQSDVKKLLLDREVKKEQFIKDRKAAKDAGTKPTAEERFAMKSKRLDDQIAMQRDMKKILSAEQYGKFEKMQMKRQSAVHKRHDRFEKVRR